MPVIEVEGLTKRFGDVVAVDDLTFSVESGRVTGFLGPNGAGKTTTFRIVLGLVRATSGRALVQGHPYHQLPAPTAHVGAVLEATGFHPGRSARDHLSVVCRAAGHPPSRVDDAMARVGLAEAAHRRVRGFSLGMRQRLGIATALVGDPGILILDEPANGLDPDGIRWLRRFLRDFADQGGAVLVSSHVLAEMSQTVDDVIIITGGRLAAQTSLAALGAGAPPAVRVRTPQAEILCERLRAVGIAAERSDPDTVRATDTTPEAVGRSLSEGGVVVLEMVTEGTSLEDVFLGLTAERTEGSR